MEGDRGRPLIPLFENRKSALILKKGPHSIHLWIKFSIKDVVLRVSRRKKTAKSFFLVF